jgi:hypothetical protein
MGYSIWLEMDTGAGNFAECGDIGDMTYNLSPMFTKALGATLGSFDDNNAGESIPALVAGVAAMESDPATYRALDPPNGWGDYDRALDYLRALLKACQDHPLARIVVS